MAFSEIRKSISSVFEERITSPFYGSFIFSWLVWNWKIVYLTVFVNQDLLKPATKIEYIIEHYSNWFHLIIFPFISAIILVAGIPWLSNRLFKIYLHYEKERIKWREETDSSKRLTFEHSAQIRNEISEQEEKHRRQISYKNDEITILKEQVERLTEEKTYFKILYARYGKNETFNDVTNALKKILSTKNKFLVNNQELGGDPLWGVHKELFIIYSFENKIYTLATREYYEVEMKNNLLIEIETEDSKKTYSAIVEKTETSSIEILFPGKWKLEYRGKLSGEEDVEIRDGNKYFAKSIQETSFKHFFNLEDILIDLGNKRIRFTKNAVTPDNRIVKSELKIIEIGKHYEGIEEDGTIKVSYFKKD